MTGIRPSSAESAGTRATVTAHARGSDPARQAFVVLRGAFTVAPVVFGADRFFDLLVNWDGYLAPVAARPLPFTSHQLRYAVGVAEIIAGLLVAVHPRLGGVVVAGWLGGVIVDLLLLPGFYDIALRDFGLFLGAVALCRLAARFDPRPLLWLPGRS
jgi:hypothetical protein